MGGVCLAGAEGSRPQPPRCGVRSKARAQLTPPPPLPPSAPSISPFPALAHRPQLSPPAARRGDEGFLCETYQADPDQTGDCYVGTDFAAFTALPSIDFGSAHLYPDAWGRDKGVAWGVAWVRNHTAIAHGLGKPMLLVR